MHPPEIEPSSRASGDRLNGRLYAEVRLLETSALSPLSFGYLAGIACRVRVKALGRYTESFPEEPLKSVLFLAVHLAFGTWSCTSASTPKRGAGQHRKTSLLNFSRYPSDRRSSMNVR